MVVRWFACCRNERGDYIIEESIISLGEIIRSYLYWNCDFLYCELPIKGTLKVRFAKKIRRKPLFPGF